MARTITIDRRNCFLLCGVSFSVCVDGQEMAAVRNGRSVKFTIDNAQHYLLVCSDRALRQGEIEIPAGNGDRRYEVSVKMPQRIVVQETDAPAPAAASGTSFARDPVNELDAYRPGGTGWLWPEKPQIEAMGPQELEEFMIGNALSVMIARGCLDVNNPTLQQIARESRVSIRSSLVELRITEGRCQYTEKLFLDDGFRRLYQAVPFDQSFDYLLSSPQKEQHCLVSQHDIGRLYRYFYTGIVRQYPSAWMVNGVLYSKKP